jgi:FlaA1/EpsC-like NDP-sugar epimerase
VERVLTSPPAGVQVVAIIDDNPALAGQAVGGVPVMGRQNALKAGIDAVVLSTDRHERQMWESTRDLRAVGIEVVCLYTPTACMSGATIERKPVREPAAASERRETADLRAG